MLSLLSTGTNRARHCAPCPRWVSSTSRKLHGQPQNTPLPPSQSRGHQNPPWGPSVGSVPADPVTPQLLGASPQPPAPAGSSLGTTAPWWLHRHRPLLSGGSAGPFSPKTKTTGVERAPCSPPPVFPGEEPAKKPPSLSSPGSPTLPFPVQQFPDGEIVPFPLGAEGFLLQPRLPQPPYGEEPPRGTPSPTHLPLPHPRGPLPTYLPLPHRAGLCRPVQPQAPERLRCRRGKGAWAGQTSQSERKTSKPSEGN